MSVMKDKYTKDIVPQLMERFKFENAMLIPKLEKIVINMGLGESIGNAKSMEQAYNEMSLIAAQKPVFTKARQSIAGFKIREGMNIGCKVTLRGARMYEFLNRLINMSLPRVRDFRGVSKSAFDGRGNYALGLKEQIIFPEIEYDKIDKIRGLNIVFVTSARTDDECRALLELFGMPFEREEK